MGTLPLHRALLKVVKLYAEINEKSGAHFSQESVCREAGFECYCSAWLIYNGTGKSVSLLRILVS
jgi:hypothetical protein